MAEKRYPIALDCPLADAAQTVKGSGSLSASTLFKDYLKNMTSPTSPVIYVYDAVGDTQGQRVFCCFQEVFWIKCFFNVLFQWMGIESFE